MLMNLASDNNLPDKIFTSSRRNTAIVKRNSKEIPIEDTVHVKKIEESTKTNDLKNELKEDHTLRKHSILSLKY